MNKSACSDLKCVRKPTRSRLSLAHLPVQPLSMVRESV